MTIVERGICRSRKNLMFLKLVLLLNKYRTVIWETVWRAILRTETIFDKYCFYCSNESLVAAFLRFL
ncbi:hypothetical protein H7K06_00735 [Priestia aryabhattai]|nr:hypothetical protein [Priestia aryabhattai]